jgi:hypothetical protein
MGFKAVPEGLIGCLLDHVRKVLRDLLFCVVDVAQGVHEQVIERFDSFVKKPMASSVRLSLTSKPLTEKRVPDPVIYGLFLARG